MTEQIDKKEAPAPVIKIQMPKSYLAEIISRQDAEFILSLRKEALNHALEHGCKGLVPKASDLKETIDNTLTKIFNDLMLERKPGYTGQFQMTARGKEIMEREVKASWDRLFAEEVSKVCLALEEDARKKIHDREKDVISRLNDYLEKERKRIDELERQMTAIVDEKLIGCFENVINEEVERRIKAKMSLQQKLALKNITEGIGDGE